MLIYELDEPSCLRPLPVEGSGACIELERWRTTAETVGDHSAVTDADVMLRRHQRQEHTP